MAQSFHYPHKPEKSGSSNANPPPVETAKEARDGSKRKGK